MGLDLAPFNAKIKVNVNFRGGRACPSVPFAIGHFPPGFFCVFRVFRGYLPGESDVFFRTWS